MLQQIIVLLLSLSLVFLFIITGSHLKVAVSCKDVNDSAEPQQNNDASYEVVLVDNVHAVADKESKLKTSWNIEVDKINSGSLLTPTQRRSSITIEKAESPAVIADRKSDRKFRRRSLIVKEKRNESGFVAYSADYGRPKHHPPKNN
ncbi:hypothetical protein POM88_018050 [Heracleum sosnowskyi]|uniref:Uncharacterized protein n=1 Tax=Heracleum sosnowskyi TaxID=360622 RepID=A0AAD8IPT9_9APIA|nr:hypothetical protein POM88_018050 [Heracleum sosnowskyi]